MDRLSKALQQAREARQNAADTQPSAPSESPASLLSPVATDAEASNKPRVASPLGNKVLLKSANAVFQPQAENQLSTPVEVLRRHMLISHIDDKRAIDAYKLLRTRVLRAMQSNSWRSVGVTSAAPNAGKTLTSANLAISLSFKQDLPVLLVDADLRIPSMAPLFEIEPKATLREYLSGTATLSEVTFTHPALPNLYILPTAATQTESSELLGGTALKRLMDEFQSAFAEGVIIVDLPPVLVGDDVVAAAGSIDTLLFIVADGQTKGRELEKSRELLADFNILGTVLNRSDETASDSGYYYYYTQGAS